MARYAMSTTSASCIDKMAMWGPRRDFIRAEAVPTGQRCDSLARPTRAFPPARRLRPLRPCFVGPNRGQISARGCMMARAHWNAPCASLSRAADRS
jgi:hypothetical protein